MKVYEKLLKQISETKYLSAENSYRYRPIMRCFYKHYERLEYWLYKEQIFNELKENEIFNDYTLEECERDLDALTEWQSLTRMQDTKNATSIEEFKNKKFRYQLTEYATEIERLTISLEEMEIKTSSLEPKLFDRLRISLANLEKILELNEEETNELWNDLMTDFTKLNENYQDYLKSFNEPKTEELLEAVTFLKYKTEIIKYLREFIRGYQNNTHHIKYSISKIDEEKIETFLNKLETYHRKNPMVDEKFDYKQYREVNKGKLNSIFNWFSKNDGSLSEGEKLMSSTDAIIVRITKYANSLIELHGNMTNRKEEYRNLVKLFDSLDDIEEANKYSSVIFGIETVRNFIGISNINTDSITNSYDIPPIEVLLNSRTKQKKERNVLTPIFDKTSEKRKILEEYRLEQEQNKKILKNLINNKKITLKKENKLSKIERRYLQKLISSRTKKETEFGLTYNIRKLDGKCKIISEDGIFIMGRISIEFEGDI